MKTRIVMEFSERWLKVAFNRKVVAEQLAGTEPAAISAAISSILKKNNCAKALEVFVVLSRNKITVRRVDLPSQDPKEIEQMLGLYLIRQTPYHKEEVCWAYQNLGFDGINNSHLILAVALKNVFKNVVSSLVPINILPESILMSSQGLIHYVSNALKDKALLQGSYMILDIDANYSELVLMHNQELSSSVVISQGAEQLKNEQEKARFAVELKQALAALNNEYPLLQPEKIFLTGSAATHLIFIEALLARDTNLKPQYVSTKEYDAITAGGLKEISLSAVLGFSYQMAKSDIKFIIPELQVKKEMKFKLQQLMILGISLVYILVMLGAVGLVRLAQQQSYATNLKAKVEGLRKNTADIEEITDKLKVVKQYVNPSASVLTPLSELSRLCPDTIIITNFNWEWQKALSFRGYAQQISDILGFMNTLSSSDTFKGAQNRYTRRRKVKDRDMVDFEIVVK